MNEDSCRRLFASARIARLATTGPVRPRLVPVVFAVTGDHIYTAVDHKLKQTRRLRRLDDIRRSPMVTLLADHYEEDWDRLWWVRVDGVASIVEDPDSSVGIDLLVERYPQYRVERPVGPLIDIEVTAWRGWSATPRPELPPRPSE